MNTFPTIMARMAITGLVLFLLLTALTACDSAPQAPRVSTPVADRQVESPGEANTPERTNVQLLQGMWEAHGDVTISPPKAATVRPAAAPWERVRKRMDIDQLEASLLRATGGLTWVDGSGRSMFSELEATLGKPDYLQRTHEDLQPGALFQKFLDDAARQICERLLERDLGSPEYERVLLGSVAPKATLGDDAEAIEANLARLLLRFHGRDDVSGLHTWRWLFESSTFVTSSTLEGWRTVCVALIVHPDFYTY